MFEFLLTHHNTENPTAISILITVLCTFFLSSLVTLTYEYTTRGTHKPFQFLQSMVLISIVAAMVMQAIGDSLARGLGMLGALAIIRFRTKLDNPRNMAFMFAALAIGIACGVFGFTIAFIGTAGFCIAAFILHFSPFGQEDPLVGVLKIVIVEDREVDTQVVQLLKAYCSAMTLVDMRFLNLNKTDKVRNEEGVILSETKRQVLKEMNYRIRMRRNKGMEEFASDLEQLPGLKDLRLRFNKEPFTL